MEIRANTRLKHFLTAGVEDILKSALGSLDKILPSAVLKPKKVIKIDGSVYVVTLPGLTLSHAIDAAKAMRSAVPDAEVTKLKSSVAVSVALTPKLMAEIEFFPNWGHAAVALTRVDGISTWLAN